METKQLTKKWNNLSPFYKINIFLGMTLIIVVSLLPVFANVATVNSGQGQVTETSTTNNGLTDWVLSYKNNTGAPVDSVNIKKEIPAGQGYVNGSLKIPGSTSTSNWSKQYSTTLPTYSQGTPPANSVAVGALGTNIPFPATSASSILKTTILSNQDASKTGGDGFIPVPYRASNGELRIFNTYHHLQWSINNDGTLKDPTPGIVCTVASTGKLCDSDKDGTPDGKFYFRTASGADPTQPDSSYYITGNAYATTVWQSKYYTPAVKITNNKPANGSNGVSGLICFDMENFTSCGFKPFGNGADQLQHRYFSTSKVIYATLNGSFQFGSKIYAVSENDNVYCFDAAANAACTNLKLNNFTDPINTDPTDSSMISPFAGVAANPAAKIAYIQNSANSSARKLACVKEVNGVLQLCSSAWGTTTSPGIVIQSGSANLTVEIVPLYSANGSTINSVCAIYNEAANATAKCYTPTGAVDTSASATAFSNFIKTRESHVAGATTSDPVNVRDVEQVANTAKILIALSNTTTDAGGVACWDSSTNAACAGFGTGGYIDWNVAIPSQTPRIQTYAMAEDDIGCVWSLGDDGTLYSFDPATGSYPCKKAKASTNITAPADTFYCDKKVHTVTWDKVILYKENGTYSNIRSLTVTVKDSTTGATLLTKTVSPTQMYSLDISSISYSQHKSLSVSYNADFKTINADSTEGFLAVVTFKGDDPQVCFQTYSKEPKFTAVKTVNKEVVKPGDEVIYTITVTNTGRVDLLNVKVSDPTIGQNDAVTIAKIAVGKSASVAFKYTIPADQSKTFTNVAKVCSSAFDIFPEKCLNPTEDVDVAEISIEKSSDPAEYAAPGQEVTYSFKVTNTGSVTLNPELVYDDVLGVIGDPKILKPGESQILQKKYIVPEDTASDSEVINNVSVCAPVPKNSGSVDGASNYRCKTAEEIAEACKDATAPAQDSATLTTPCKVTVKCDPTVKNIVCADDVHKLKIVPATIAIEKTASAEKAKVGDVVTYSFKVTNPTKVTIKNIAVTDNIIGDIGTIDSLAPGESKTLTKDYKVPSGSDKITNTAKACFAIPKITKGNCAEDNHTLTVTQTSVLGAVSTALPFTGSAAEMLVKTALWLLAIGGLAGLVSRKRKAKA